MKNTRFVKGFPWEREDYEFHDIWIEFHCDMQAIRECLFVIDNENHFICKSFVNDFSPFTKKFISNEIHFK